MLKDRKINLKPDRVMAAILLIYLIITISTLANYSDAWDNVTMFEYGRQSAQIYARPFQHYFPHEYGPVDIRFFGPILVTGAYFLDKLVGPALGFWSTLDIFRLCYFLIYLAGVWAFFKLGKRYLSPWISLFSTLLLVTQPLLYGQAPVSPKDTTFLAMTIIGVYLGLRMIDELPEAKEPILPQRAARNLGILTGIYLIFLLIYQGVIEVALRWAAGMEKSSVIGQLFRRAAAEYPSVAIEHYIGKLSTLALRAGIAAFVIAALAILGFRVLSRLWAGFKGKYVLPAGIMFGLGISTRILGLLAGGVILIILLTSRKIKDWFYTLTAYSLTATAMIYLTWPYLWPKPIGRFLESLQVNLGHQHNPSVMFNGASYAAADLPSWYVPTLIGVQFTIPLIILAIAGMALILSRYKNHNRQLFILSLVWFVLPVSLFMLLRPAMHDNIRHILFITPPLFLLAGFTAEKIAERLNGKFIIGAILASLALLPGLIHIVQYHPYEYIYYNQLAGGAEKGVTLFEADYLALSLSEGIEFINQTAEPSSTVYVMGPENIARSIIREDLNLVSRNNNPDDRLDTPNTYLVSYRPVAEPSSLDALYQVRIGDVLLGGVYKHPNSE